MMRIFNYHFQVYTILTQLRLVPTPKEFPYSKRMTRKRLLTFGFLTLRVIELVLLTMLVNHVFQELQLIGSEQNRQS